MGEARGVSRIFSEINTNVFNKIRKLGSPTDFDSFCHLGGASGRKCLSGRQKSPQRISYLAASGGDPEGSLPGPPSGVAGRGRRSSEIISPASRTYCG